MPTTSSTVGQIQLDDLVEGVNRIYSNKDAKRSLWDVWMHANHHASAIGEGVRKGGTKQLLDDIADSAMWLFTMVKKLQGPIGSPKPPNNSEQESVIRIANSYSDILWKRFPGMCPFCYWRRTSAETVGERLPEFTAPCDCLSHEVKKLGSEQKHSHTTALRAYGDENLARKPAGVDEWQTMFGAVFAANLRQLELSDIALHLLEEMGEMSDALLRMYTYSDKTFVAEQILMRQIRLEEQLSDVSSWFFALVEKLDNIRGRVDEYVQWLRSSVRIEGGRILLSQIIWRRYGSDDLEKFVCWKCKEPSCKCPIIIVPIDRSVAELREVIKSARNS